ncbi:hypothetical protein VE01_10245 [Pseudogymnoascus verrucosus]|uniref:J domain-containing protein n=1 Tax=Pseudogymnoascus verrucosus TaxID=342668 RepID=A0A1B8G7A0_9PEZI|nr:uncharacterized protein VE01_10245 [Pseudogymnoascus verrucosus]OBT91691.2 hypothetical protein VE01_10245 [Pseudogymnoascus verrucosus]
MVKADLTRDYYGDLEIAPNATEIEIKKQFRSLALKYHPDRNPGRELEVNAKFQTIQSAHEVLTDPEQRAKYDVGRSRGGGAGGGFASQARPASGFARGNPWANVATDFPPPPRPSRSRAQPPPPSAGAQRYANNFKPGSGAYTSASSGAKPAEDDGAEARRKTYEAWSKMRGGKAPPPYNPHGYQPTPGTDERRSSRQQVPKPQPPPIPKRNGYAPGAAGGDEPAAANTSAYYTQRAGRAPTAKQQPPPQKTPPRNAPVDPLRQFREKTGTPLEPRLSTPYASHGGEKTDPFESVNFGRSNSTRTPSGRAGGSRGSGSSGTRERHRSASPSRPSRTPRLSPELNAGSRVGSDTNLNTSPKRTFSRATRASNMSEPRTTEAIVDYSSSSSDESEDVQQRVYAKSRSRRTQAQATPTGTAQASHDQQSHGAQNAGRPNADPKIFTFQVDGETYTAHSVPRQFPTTSSTENISTTFTPTDWHGKFEAGEDYFGKEAAAQPARGNSTSRARNRSPPKPRVPPVSTKSPYPNIDPEILQQSSGTEGATSSPGGTKFSAEEWAQTFKPGIFAPPPHPSPGSLSRSRTNSSRRAKAASSSSKGPPVTKTTGTAAMVDSGDDEPQLMGSRPVPGAETGASTFAQPPLVSSPTAMDIDPPQPTNDARNVYVEPTRAEWRPSDTTSTSFGAPPSSAPGPALPPKEALNTSGLAANLDDLKKTEPLYTPPAGLSSFADLTSNLPFASKAATTAPVGKGVGFKPANLDLPQPPRGPSPPAIAPDAPRPTQAAWDTYMASMHAYMAAWDAFNTQMVCHFVARKNEVDTFPKGWLGTIGGKVVSRYVEGVREDEKVRMWWDTACGRHGAVMEDFVWAREVFQSGVQAVGGRGEKVGGRLYGEV